MSDFICTLREFKRCLYATLDRECNLNAVYAECRCRVPMQEGTVEKKSNSADNTKLPQKEPVSKHWILNAIFPSKSKIKKDEPNCRHCGKTEGRHSPYGTCLSGEPPNVKVLKTYFEV